MKKLFCLLAVLALLAQPLRAAEEPKCYLALDRKSTRLNSSHYQQSRMPSSA